MIAAFGLSLTPSSGTTLSISERSGEYGAKSLGMKSFTPAAIAASMRSVWVMVAGAPRVEMSASWPEREDMREERV